MNSLGWKPTSGSGILLLSFSIRPLAQLLVVDKVLPGGSICLIALEIGKVRDALQCERERTEPGRKPIETILLTGAVRILYPALPFLVILQEPTNTGAKCFRRIAFLSAHVRLASCALLPGSTRAMAVEYVRVKSGPPSLMGRQPPWCLSATDFLEIAGYSIQVFPAAQLHSKSSS